MDAYRLSVSGSYGDVIRKHEKCEFEETVTYAPLADHPDKHAVIREYCCKKCGRIRREKVIESNE